MELFCARAGESAAFYAWLLSTDAETGSDDWEPIHLLAERGVISVRRAGAEGPGTMWIPALLVDDVEETAEQMRAEGGSLQRLEHGTYLVDSMGVWTRLVPGNAIPFGLDPDLVSETVLDYITTDVPAVAAAYTKVFGLEPIELVDDPHGYMLLLDGQHIALGVANYATAARSPVPHPGWIMYFDVPDVMAATTRAVTAGATVVIAPVHEDYNTWAVLVDPFGVTFGLSTYHDFSKSDVVVRTRSGEVVPLSQAARLT